jgi:hypothetical protein
MSIRLRRHITEGTNILSLTEFRCQWAVIDLHLLCIPNCVSTSNGEKASFFVFTPHEIGRTPEGESTRNSGI